MSLHMEDLRRLCDDGEAGPEDKKDEVEEKTEVDADEDGEEGERVGVSVSFRRSGSKGESTGE
jgi:hypothetical protein